LAELFQRAETIRETGRHARVLKPNEASPSEVQPAQAPNEAASAQAPSEAASAQPTAPPEGFDATMTQRFTRVLGPPPAAAEPSPGSWLESGVAESPAWLDEESEAPAPAWLGGEAPTPDWLDEESEERAAWLATSAPSWVLAESEAASFLDEALETAGSSWVGDDLGSTGWLDGAQPQSSSWLD
jgi:hypothetical protein